MTKMTDKDKEALLWDVLERRKYVPGLSRDEFLDLLDGLQRMFFARVMNCIDASAKKDPEWMALSSVCLRALTELDPGYFDRTRGEDAPVDERLDPKET